MLTRGCDLEVAGRVRRCMVDEPNNAVPCVYPRVGNRIADTVADDPADAPLSERSAPQYHRFYRGGGTGYHLSVIAVARVIVRRGPSYAERTRRQLESVRAVPARGHALAGSSPSVTITCAPESGPSGNRPWLTCVSCLTMPWTMP